MTKDQGAGLTREPNVLPMIDVMLVLLIIFMLIRPGKLEVQIPVPEGESDAPATPIVLTVARGPSYAINRTPVAADQLVPELTRIYKDRPEKVLFVEGQRDVRYQHVVTAFDAARGAGVAVTSVKFP